MSTNETNTSTQPAAAEVPQPAPTLSPETVVEQLRAIRAQIGEVTPLTSRQRTTLRSRARASNPILQASINVIGALDNVSQAVGQPAGQVRELQEEANRWTAVEDELRTMLKGVNGANLIRRQRIVLIAAQAANIGAQLARDPANAVLIPHVEEVRRLRSFARRKKAEPAPDGTPSPAPGTPPAPQPHPPGGVT
jgi:hypothetical protein